MESTNKTTSQIVSKQRVSSHGEVFTAPREVNAMLDLVKQETERIDSRFLEPACGKGAFLTEIIKRKLKIVKDRYSKSQIEYERYAFLAVTSIYGIDILQDNVTDCIKILLKIFQDEYKDSLKKECSKEYLDSVNFILNKNIICGGALTLKRVDKPNIPIVFCEWSSINGKLYKRKDFIFEELIESSLASDFEKSDLGNEVWFPKPVKEYSPTHYLKLKDIEGNNI